MITHSFYSIKAKRPEVGIQTTIITNASPNQSKITARYSHLGLCYELSSSTIVGMDYSSITGRLDYRSISYITYFEGLGSQCTLPFVGSETHLVHHQHDGEGASRSY